MIILHFLHRVKELLNELSDQVQVVIYVIYPGHGRP